MGDYTIKVFAANSKAGTTSSAMAISLLGDVAFSDEIQVTDHGFTRGDIYQVSAKTGIVGNIMMIKVRMTNPEELAFICTKIQVILAYKLWEFPCSKPLYKQDNGKPMTLSVQGRTSYTVKVSICKASADPVWIELMGSEGGSLMTMLSDHGFNEGDFTIPVYADYVGIVNKIKIQKTDGTPLCVKKIDVAYTGAQNSVKFNKQTTISSLAVFEVPKPPNPPSNSSSALANAAAKVKPPPKDKTPIEEFNDIVKKIDAKQASIHFSGQCLPEEDEKEISEVSCDAVFKDILAKYSYDKSLPFEKFPNIQTRLFKCPQGCLPPKGPSIGLLIHHPSSNICASAIADRAIDHTGGVISITMTKAQTTWNTEFTTVNGISIESGDKANVSFVIAKVDTPSMTEKRIRLINDKGEIDSKGRLEIKIDRMWSTVGRGDKAIIMDNVAYSACKYLGYAYGIVTNDSSPIDPGQLVPQNKIYCENKSGSFGCMLEKNDAISHSSDIVVECQDMDPTNPNKPDGYMDFYKPYEGSNDKFPVVYYNNKLHFFCAESFDSKEYADR